MSSLKLNRFDPRVMEKRRREGNPPTCIFIGKRGTGKCLARDTPVIMDNGTIKMIQDIVVGDMVMGDDSKPRKVLSLSRGVSNMYKIKQTSGQDYIVNENHILSLRSTSPDKLIDISVRDYMNLSDQEKENLRGYRVPVEFEKSELPVDPYILGLWLSTKKDITNKHIPHVYKCNNRKNRLRLLAGLVDCGGHIDNCSDVLIKDITFLAQSLGFTCKTEKGKLYISKKKQSTTIEVEKLKKDKYYGFEIDGNHRFLLGDFTVTHNSTLISDIMYFHKSVPYGIIMSGTEDGNGYYAKYFPSLFIHSTFKKELVSTLVRRQKRIIKDPNINPHAFLLLDDLMYDKSVTKEKNMRQIFMNGRHWKLLFLLSMQYCMDLPPDLRANVDYLFILRENIIDNQRKLWKYFFGMYNNFSDFQQTLIACTENYECLVLDNTSKSNKIEDCVFWYKATPNRKYKIGCPQLWEYAKNNFDKDYEKEEDEDIGPKSNKKPSMVIKKKGIKK